MVASEVMRPAVEASAWREQLPVRALVPVPTSLRPLHWFGGLVSADDFVTSVNAAVSGARIITGVCSELPLGTAGLAVLC